MENDLFTVEQVAVKLDLHPKTIRRFIQEGRLKARKVGKQWRITSEDLMEFAGNSNPAVEPNRERISGIASGGNDDEVRQRIQVSTVVDVFVENTDEAVRLTNTLFALMNCKDPSYKGSRCDHVYYKDQLKARYILWGSPQFISDILGCISAIVGNKA